MLSYINYRTRKQEVASPRPLSYVSDRKNIASADRFLRRTFRLVTNGFIRIAFGEIIDYLISLIDYRYAKQW